jgi:hypothetical protein
MCQVMQSELGEGITAETRLGFGLVRGLLSYVPKVAAL